MTHFYSVIPDALRELSHREAVKRYAEGRSVPKQGMAGLSSEELNSHPIPGTWSIQQIIMHLMDSDLIASYRMKRMIAEERPKLDVYDEAAFAKRLHYEKLSTSLACEVFRINRLVTSELLRHVPDETFDRVAVHPEVGKITLGAMVRLYVHHLDHHNRFLREKRRLVLASRGT